MMSIHHRGGLMKAEIRPGQSFPLGATIYPDGVNFSVYSKNVTAPVSGSTYLVLARAIVRLISRL
jgi:pullulanase/glycogen debranching enzyme